MLAVIMTATTLPVVILVIATRDMRSMRTGTSVYVSNDTRGMHFSYIAIYVLPFLIVLSPRNAQIMFNLQLSALEVVGMVEPVQNLKPAIVLQDGLDKIVKMVSFYYVGHII